MCYHHQCSLDFLKGANFEIDVANAPENIAGFQIGINDGITNISNDSDLNSYYLFKIKYFNSGDI